MRNVKVLVYLTHIIAIHCKHVKILEKVLEVSATYCCVALRLSTFFFIFSGGDVTPKNIWLIESCLDIFAEYRFVSCHIKIIYLCILIMNEI